MCSRTNCRHRLSKKRSGKVRVQRAELQLFLFKNPSDLCLKAMPVPLPDADSIPSSGEECSPELPDVDEPQEDPELPDGVCCKMGCLEAIQESPQASKGIKELQMLFDTTDSQAELDQLKYDCLRHWQSAEHGWRRFCIFGLPCCVRAVQDLLKVSRNVQVKRCKHLQEGNRLPPADQRKTKTNTKLSPQVAAAHALLAWLWNNVAEVLVESSDYKGTMDVKHYDVKKAEAKLPKLDKSLLQPTHGTSGFLDPPAGVQGVRWLSPGTTLVEMYDTCVAFNDELDDTPGYKTFSRVYHSTWQHVLKVRPEGTHSLPGFNQNVVCELFFIHRFLSDESHEFRKSSQRIV